MKKNLLILSAVAVSVMAAAFFFTPKYDAERLLDANVKALAENVGAEVNASSDKTQCFNKYDNSRTNFVCLPCGTCEYVVGKGTNVGGWCPNSKIKVSIGSDDPHIGF